MPNIDVPQGATERFFKVASDILRAAELGQFGPNYTPDNLRKELDLAVKNLVPNWSPEKFPYVLTSPEQDVVLGIVEQAVAKYIKWLGDDKPPIG